MQSALAWPFNVDWIRRMSRQFGGRLLVGGIAVALAIHGITGAVVMLLGTQHMHATAPRGDVSVGRYPHLAANVLELEDFRRLPAAMTHGGHAHHGHHHGDAERHHHERGDATVVSAGGEPTEGGNDDGGTAASMPLFALARAEETLRLLEPELRWAPASRVGVARWSTGRVERPPKG